ALVGAILLFAKQVTEAFGIDISSQLETISGILGSIITILVALGVVTNPNTKGVSDAGIDFELNKPRNEYTHPVQFKSESGAVKPENFDTNEPFTDDSDEEEFEFDNGGGGAPDENTISNQ
ncbi:phage holin, partial [Staphylococcus capitis]